MSIRLSPQTIEALTLVISGGSYSDTTKSIGLYRTGPKIESFMRGCNIQMSVGSFSRLPSLAAAIEAINSDANQVALRTVIESAADPRDFLDDPEKHDSVIDYLNARLVYDGVELRRHGRKVRLVPAGLPAHAVASLTELAATIDFDTVSRDLDRALSSAKEDPEDVVTSACSVVESVCRSILVELGMPLPEKRDIQGLYRAVREPLGLQPTAPVARTEIADDVRAILGGLNTVVQSVGALRTHGGDAHGRERGHGRHIDERIARLAIHSASAVALFLIETWQKKYPAKPLRAY